MMTTYKIEHDHLIINIKGMDKLWALKSKLSIPLQHITGVTYQPEIAHGWWHGWRLPGTHIPGVLIAGSFYQHGEWTFWNVRSPEKTIVITLKDERYKKLVIEVKDPHEAIVEINSVINI